ncbi:MAG: GNAT family N-acetyltransferase [Anaerolineae bacterium]|nr:GNAT family N-acetyltransferase [Anaerolineae bacterium]
MKNSIKTLEVIPTTGSNGYRLAEKGLTLREGRVEDAQATGTICYEAFKTISGQHNFPEDFPSPEVAAEFLAFLFSHPNVYSVVAELEGQVVGSNFLWETAIIAGVGPITVSPTVQNGQIGRRLMEDVLARAKQQGFAGVRLVQAAYHNRSLSLYTKLGFVAREPLSVVQGPALGLELPGYMVRAATTTDVEAANRLSFNIHGLTREQELLDAIQQGTATVVERDGRLTGYATSVGFLGYAMGETNDDLKALIGAAPSFAGPGFILPTRNTELFRWCLKQGLRVVQPLTLMSLGLYNEPAGAFLPSVIY